MYLDEFPSGGQGKGTGKEQYWELFIKKLKNMPKVGNKFSYTNIQITQHSPSQTLLYDLQEKELELSTFFHCLQKIGCTGAMNVFSDASKDRLIDLPTYLSIYLSICLFVIHSFILFVYLFIVYLLSFSFFLFVSLVVIMITEDGIRPSGYTPTVPFCLTAYLFWLLPKCYHIISYHNLHYRIMIM